MPPWSTANARALASDDATRSAALQRHQAAVGRPEPTGVEVELAEVVVEVDVQPLTAGGSRPSGRDIDDRLADALTPGGRGHHRVLDEGVHESVPEHVDESDEAALIVASDNPPEAVRGRQLAPVPLIRGEQARLERLG